MEYFFLLIFGYLLGSISGAIIISRFLKLPDPRASGSKNPGATNVLRLGNRQAATATLIFDILKGTVAVSIANWLIGNSLGMCLAGISVFIGHLFPIYFKFKGGKGVATGLGIFLAINLKVFAALIVTWIIIAVISRYSSLAAITSALTAPFWSFLLIPDKNFSILAIMISIFLVCRHMSNIKRLLKKTETKIGKKN